MTRFPLTSEERQATGFTDRFTLTFDDLTETATAMAQVFTLCTLPAGSLVINVATRLTTAFSDASDAAFNSCALTVGDTGTANLFVTSQELNVNGTEILAKAGTGTQKAYPTADALKCTVNSMTAKALNDIDAGALTIFAKIANLATLAGS